MALRVAESGFTAAAAMVTTLPAILSTTTTGRASRIASACAVSPCVSINKTSSISITAIAAEVKNPERVAGLHFFNPAPVMKLVEVVSGLATAAEVVEQLCELTLSWGKQPVRCHSTPGFIVNRVARPYYSEAWRANFCQLCKERFFNFQTFRRRFNDQLRCCQRVNIGHRDQAFQCAFTGFSSQFSPRHA